MDLLLPALSAKGSDQEFEVCRAGIGRTDGFSYPDFDSRQQLAGQASQAPAFVATEPAAPKTAQANRNYRYRPSRYDFFDAGAKVLDLPITSDAPFRVNADEISRFEFSINAVECSIQQMLVFLR